MRLNAAPPAVAQFGLRLVIVGMLDVAGVIVTVALALFVPSATLVAITLTACVADTTGAVYNPLVPIVPRLGLNDQVTDVFDDPETDAENCSRC